jgi:hypothetical protein
MVLDNGYVDITRLDQSTFRADLEELDQWLSDRGFIQRDRFRLYKANIEEMTRLEDRSDAAQVFSRVENEGRVTEILSSYVEGIEFVDALTTLRAKQITIPDHLLSKVLDGPPDAARENHKSNQGRNAMFELSMGAMVAKQDFHPVLGQANPDVEFQFQGRRVLLECKRVFSDKRVLDNIADAIRQLDKSVDTGNADIGLVAISISRLAHQGNGYWEATSLEQGRAYLAQAMRRLVGDLDARLRKLVRPSTAGVVFFVSGPLRVENIGYTVATEGIVYPMNLAETGFLRQLASALRV